MESVNHGKSVRSRSAFTETCLIFRWSSCSLKLRFVATATMREFWWTVLPGAGVAVANQSL